MGTAVCPHFIKFIQVMGWERPFGWQLVKMLQEMERERPFAGGLVTGKQGDRPQRPTEDCAAGDIGLTILQNLRLREKF